MPTISAGEGEKTMAERILTLCTACKAELEIGYRVKPISGPTSTEKKKRCEQCGQSYGGTCKQYIVSPKR